MIENINENEEIPLIQINPEVGYNRKIISIEFADPEQYPYLFHTSASDINEISLNKCRSHDYLINGKPINVIYLLPHPHYNRVRDYSEIWTPSRVEAQDKHGYHHSYLMAEYKNKEVSLRMGSTMEAAWLLATVNNGQIFKIKLEEINPDGSKKELYEFISLKDQLVEQGIQIKIPSPMGINDYPTMHIPEYIDSPDFVGYQSLDKYLQTISNMKQRIQLTGAANRLFNTPIMEFIPQEFSKMVKKIL